MEEAERRIPAELRHRDRLVSVADFEELALCTPGVEMGRVEVLPLYHPDAPDVAEPHRGGQGRGERLEMIDRARVVRVVVPPPQHVGAVGQRPILAEPAPDREEDAGGQHQHEHRVPAPHGGSHQTDGGPRTVHFANQMTGVEQMMLTSGGDVQEGEDGGIDETDPNPQPALETSVGGQGTNPPPSTNPSSVKPIQGPTSPPDTPPESND